MEEEFDEENTEEELSDDDDDDTVHVMTPEQADVFVDLNKMMKIETVPKKIDDYLRSLVKAMIMVTPSMYPMDRIFHIIMRRINNFIMSQEELLSALIADTTTFKTSATYVRLGGLTSEQIGLICAIRTRWTNHFYDLMLKSIVRRETLDLNGNIITWSEEIIHAWMKRIAVVGCHRIVDANTEMTQIETWAYRQWDHYRHGDWGVCLNRVIVEEHEDRYVEKYLRWKTSTYVDDDDKEHRVVGDNIVEMTSRTIWKRELWREELHTIPFKAIHEEMMYSPNLEGKIKNVFTETKVHFDSLRQ